MPRPFAGYALFWKQFRTRFVSTGAITPSSRALAAELARPLGDVADAKTSPGRRPRAILEVGPGTGAVTDQLLRRLGPQDRLTLVECNPDFVQYLKTRLSSDPFWQARAGQVELIESTVETWNADQRRFDVLVSGLPLNNFPVALVEQILARFEALGSPGGACSFFEYAGIRNLKIRLAKPEERARLIGVGQTLAALLARQAAVRRTVWFNLPPAWVHHIAWPTSAAGSATG